MLSTQPKTVSISASRAQNRQRHPYPQDDLIARAQRGDVDAFSQLYEANRKRVYWLCLRMVHDPADAEDLTQEAFLQVFRKLHTFRRQSAFTTWLHRVATNTVLMRLRKHPDPELLLDQENDETGETMEVEQQDLCLTASVYRITLERLIDKLPQGYRMIFILHDIYGYEHRDIAKILNCSEGNSKSQLHKARLKLRKLAGVALDHRDRESEIEIAA